MPPDSQNILSKLNVQRLPSLPHVLVDMLRACQGSQASFQELAQIISKDVAISARVIALANSSFFRTSTSVNSLERALLVLGIDTIKTIVITSSVQQFFSDFGSDHTHFLKLFWKRSLTCALIAKSLAILTSYPNPEEAYLTGLLHNIGELVLENNHPESFTKLISEETNESIRARKEHEHFSVSHTEVGAWLAKEWDLSDFTADAIEFHHAPNESVQDAHHLVKLISLASHLSASSEHHTSTEEDIGHQLFELNSSLVTEIVQKIKNEVQDIAASLNIDIEPSASQDKDQQAQIALAQQVRNIGLIQTASSELNRANSKIELGRAFQSTLELLFGYPNSAVFWYQAADNELSFIMPDHPDSVPLKFKLEAGRSVIADSALENSIRCAFDLSDDSNQLDQSPVIDQQIAHLVQTKGLICIPIQRADSLFCVLVVGSDQPLKPHSAQTQLLRYFADEISLACEDTLKHIRASENNVSNDELNQRAREIAHEANNPLNIINNYLASLGHRLSNPSSQNDTKIQNELSIVREEVERTSQILLRLNDLKHDTQETQSGVDINEEIKNKRN